MMSEMLQLIIDELGRTVTVPRSPQRIVSLVPSLTEWLFAIGAGERVVGVTDYCLHPADRIRSLPRLRGTKNPDRAQIVALQPDLVIANKEENRARDVDALTAAGLNVYVTDPRTVAAAITTLDQIAHVVGATAAARPLIAEMRATYNETRRIRSDYAPRVLALIWRDPWMAIGADTYADDLIRSCGATNAAAELEGRYPRLELDTLRSIQPDLILLPSEPYAWSNADLPALQSVYNGSVTLVDGELLTWYGPRVPLALRTFRELIGSAAHG